jgi:hypothetical protein
MRREIRNQMAVALNWNSLSAFFWIHVETELLEGLRGPTRSQPVWDPSFVGQIPASLGNAAQRMLPGGGLQYFFPKIPVPPNYYGTARGRTF